MSTAMMILVVTSTFFSKRECRDLGTLESDSHVLMSLKAKRGKTISLVLYFMILI
jgi:hypothetical protein